MTDDRAVGPRSGVGGPKPKQADSLPVPPGGERQDPCEWTILHCGVDVQAGNAIVHGPDVPAESPVRVVEASSVPVGGAPREKVADALYGHLGDFSTYEKCLELADAAIAAMRGSE